MGRTTWKRSNREEMGKEGKKTFVTQERWKELHEVEVNERTKAVRKSRKIVCKKKGKNNIEM